MMDLLGEIFFELLLEGSLELGTNRKVPKWIRYPVLILLVLFFSLIVGLIFVVGLSILKKNVGIGLFLIAAAIILLIGTIIKFKNIYKSKKDSQNS